MFILILSFILTSFGLAQTKHVMNGIEFNTYAGFEKKWKLVTVRYRKDNRELRYIYANNIAWKTITNKRAKFLEGAVFAKVAYLAQPDPAFESSLGPSQSRRIQFMVKDSKKYKAQNGWGYALFNPAGEVNPEPVEDQVMACASCHNIIPERDYVFAHTLNHPKPLDQKLFQYSYKEVQRSELPESISKILPSDWKTVLKVESPLTKNVFQGTLDELRPSLSKLSVNAKKPVLFLSDDSKKFSLLYPESLSIECNDEGVKGLFIVSVSSLLNDSTNKVEFCQSFH